MLKIALIIAFRNFRDEEYFIPKEVFERAGASVITFSTAIGTAVGVHGGEVPAQLTVEELKVADYDAVIFVGGAGAKKLMENEDALRVARETAASEKILAAICIAPTILARAGVLFGKKATVWSSSMDRSAIKILQEEGVLYREGPIVVDGKIITANGPEVAREFARKMLALLTSG
ncbi:MAG: ThiJ/PfpI domain-containing protein [Parcubacteria group bacterium GW2011_GWA2_47_9]|nr:MAG: ThiJ/PfpI domain-containing protein [Parcubacteria group bacterium GW2011_GWA2_47_9]